MAMLGCWRSIMKEDHSYLVLEALKDEFSLLVLVLPNPVLSFEFVVLDGL